MEKTSDAAEENELIRRRDAAQDALDHWKTQPWRMGYADCARMAARHLRLMGHNVRLPPEGSYRSVRTALTKLRGLGYDSIAEALDNLGLEQIVPAAAIVGDIIQLPGETEDDCLSALTIALGNGRVVGWHPDAPDGATTMQPNLYRAAWRVTLRLKV